MELLRGPTVPLASAREKASLAVTRLVRYLRYAETIFKELDLPSPDVNLGVGSGSHAEQTALVMTRLESHLLKLDEAPRAIVVYGDVNSTMAASLVAAKLSIPVAHVEAGLRSFDRSMPEEISQ